MTKEIWNRNLVWKMFTTDSSAFSNSRLVHITLLHSCGLEKWPQSNTDYEKLLVLIRFRPVVLVLMWIGISYSPRATYAEKLYQLRLDNWPPVLQYDTSIVTKLLIFLLSDKKENCVISFSDYSSGSYLSQATSLWNLWVWLKQAFSQNTSLNIKHTWRKRLLLNLRKIRP